MLVDLLINGAMVLINNNRQHFSSDFLLTLFQLEAAVRITVELDVGFGPFRISGVTGTHRECVTTPFSLKVLCIVTITHSATGTVDFMCFSYWAPDTTHAFPAIRTYSQLLPLIALVPLRTVSVSASRQGWTCYSQSNLEVRGTRSINSFVMSRDGRVDCADLLRLWQSVFIYFQSNHPFVDLDVNLLMPQQQYTRWLEDSRQFGPSGGGSFWREKTSSHPKCFWHCFRWFCNVSWQVVDGFTSLHASVASRLILSVTATIM